MHAGERRLWLTVLLEGLREAVDGTDPYWPWSRDFRKVCDLADLDSMAMLTVYEIAKGTGRTFRPNEAGRADGGKVGSAPQVDRIRR
jgi:hypothetical protein